MTHDLLKNLLIGLEATVQKVVVTELREDTFSPSSGWIAAGNPSASIPGRRTRWRWRFAWIARFLWKRKYSKPANRQPPLATGWGGAQRGASQVPREPGRGRSRPLQDVSPCRTRPSNYNAFIWLDLSCKPSSATRIPSACCVTAASRCCEQPRRLDISAHRAGAWAKCWACCWNALGDGSFNPNPK